jgi:hypothetical protein
MKGLIILLVVLIIGDSINQNLLSDILKSPPYDPCTLHNS